MQLNTLGLFVQLYSIRVPSLISLPYWAFQGCDASILLDSDNQNINTEIGSLRNFGIRKRESLSQIKTILEMECPGTVSCADIIALAAKESVFYSGGPDIRIPLGRRDSTNSSYQQADVHLPSSQISVDELLELFMAKGMNVEESVAILGAHTLGVGHCLSIVRRLYDPKLDMQMDSSFELLLRIKCPTKIPLSNLTFVTNDITPVIFDNQYYHDIIGGKGLFGIDSSISKHSQTAQIVIDFALNENYFFKVFSSAFVKLLSSNVLTGKYGEIRNECNKINHH
ncbi:hypothetical protein GIB67_026945 [Kingdonia uniflora]|uniref:Peroxidase n=1 Tax=Kingdonia uniflora TaxID=39325 RepID=A0A7J7P1P5_9MAGN|nr:hypothetical protein GIB67_026945 [Kingdonia uniflora]